MEIPASRKDSLYFKFMPVEEGFMVEKGLVIPVGDYSGKFLG